MSKGGGGGVLLSVPALERRKRARGGRERGGDKRGDRSHRSAFDFERDAREKRLQAKRGKESPSTLNLPRCWWRVGETKHIYISKKYILYSYMSFLIHVQYS